MTLIVSMRAKHGAAVLADSQETVKDRYGDEFKYAVLKNSPERLKGFHFLVAGGGDGDGIDELSENFRRALKTSDCRTLENFRNLFERHLKLELKSLQKQDPSARIELIVAATKNSKWEVWKSARATLVPTIAGPPTLVGFETELYKHVGGALLPRATSQVQIILVGLTILELARKSSTCVDAPHHGVLIVPSGMLVIPDKILRELTNSISTFQAYLDDLLLASADPTMGRPEFNHKLEEFQATALELRSEYLQTVNGEDMLAELRGAPSGIRFMPDNYSRTTSFGTAGISVKVNEYNPVKQSASQKLEPEK